MAEEQTNFLEPRENFFIKGEVVSKSKSLTTFEVRRAGVPPSVLYSEGQFWLSTVVWIDDNVLDLRHPITKREAAYLMSQTAKSMAQYFAYNEIEND